MSEPPLDPFDRAAYESLTAALKARGFNAVPGTNRRDWSGPLPDSLAPFTSASRMILRFRDGWPFRAPRILVQGMRLEHVAASGEVCLWADDDPAQHRASDPDVLFGRIDEWAAQATTGFRPADAALDAHLYYERPISKIAEVDLRPILSRKPPDSGRAYAQPVGVMYRVDYSGSLEDLSGRWFLLADAPEPPSSLDEVLACISKTQAKYVRRAIESRLATAIGERSGGLDFLMLVWPQHGSHNALIVFLSGAGSDVTSHSVVATPGDPHSVTARSGTDHAELSGKKVLIVGAGAIGGQIALGLASSGVGELHIADSDVLTRVNVVRHVAGAEFVGWPKALAVKTVIAKHAPSPRVETHDELGLAPADLMSSVEGFDLVVDATGMASVTGCLAVACAEEGVALVTVALYRGGRVSRARRQAGGDTHLWARRQEDGYEPIPRGTQVDDSGFLETGCSAPIHNASPIAVIRAAGLGAAMAVDALTGRSEMPDEVIERLQSLPEDAHSSGADWAGGEPQGDIDGA